jgi:hypothetical protein
VLELELDEVWIFLIDGGNAMVVSSGHIYVGFLFCFNNASKTFYNCDGIGEVGMGGNNGTRVLVKITALVLFLQSRLFPSLFRCPI